MENSPPVHVSSAFNFGASSSKPCAGRVSPARLAARSSRPIVELRPGEHTLLPDSPAPLRPFKTPPGHIWKRTSVAEWDTVTELVLERRFLSSTPVARTEGVTLENGRIPPEGQPVKFSHQPVLLDEAVEYLGVAPGGVYLDCTVGEGGHAQGVLSAAMPGGTLLGIDLDSDALERANQRLRAFDGAYTLAHGNYVDATRLAQESGFLSPDGILFDMGLSSRQLEAEGRGFSLQRDEPLDMRFDQEATLTAGHIVNRFSFEKLVEIISSYGEEPRARSIARSIISRRPIETTLALADLVAEVTGGQRGRIHPATRTFQALRIAVNSELENIKKGLEEAINLLKPGGSLVVISYHSLEDRIVKRVMATEARGCICPPRVPVCSCGHTASLAIVTRRVVTPSRDEVRGNPRSRSSRMRVARRL